MVSHGYVHPKRAPGPNASPRRQLPDDIGPGPAELEDDAHVHHGRLAPPDRATLQDMDASILTAIVFPIIGTVITVGLALGIMAWRITGQLDRRIDNDKTAADADRRAIQARFDTAMDTFRAEMQRLAERQSRVEGRSSAAD